MEEMQDIRITALSEKERAMVKDIVDTLKQERRYSNRADVYHRIFMHGCKTFLTAERK